MGMLNIHPGDRTFWTCRDTQVLAQDGDTTAFITSTASYSNIGSAGVPRLSLPDKDPLSDVVLRQYGDNSEKQAFFPVIAPGCPPPSGACSNGSRYALWPDQPPMVAQRRDDGSLVAYTWIGRSIIEEDLKTLTPFPATTLYRVNYKPSQDQGNRLPDAKIVDQEFYGVNEIPYGVYGNIVRNGVA
jgi:hypothetical protein